MTEKEKMLAGEIYSAVDQELLEELSATRDKIFEKLSRDRYLTSPPSRVKNLRRK